MSETINVLREFKTQLIAFFDELIEQFPREGDLVVLRLFIANQMIIEDAISQFSHKINGKDGQIRKMVEARDEKFFITENVFSVLGETDTNFFVELWLSKKLDKDDKEIIWQWVDALIFLTDKYLKTKTTECC